MPAGWPPAARTATAARRTPIGAEVLIDHRPVSRFAGVMVTCPRCGREVEERFYGPCTDCRRELRAAFARDAVIVEVAEYEPKMNVTPNAVATKD